MSDQTSHSLLLACCGYYFPPSPSLIIVVVLVALILIGILTSSFLSPSALLTNDAGKKETQQITLFCLCLCLCFARALSPTARVQEQKTYIIIIENRTTRSGRKRKECETQRTHQQRPVVSLIELVQCIVCCSMRIFDQNNSVIRTMSSPGTAKNLRMKI